MKKTIGSWGITKNICNANLVEVIISDTFVCWWHVTSETKGLRVQTCIDCYFKVYKIIMSLLSPSAL